MRMLFAAGKKKMVVSMQMLKFTVQTILIS